MKTKIVEIQNLRFISILLVVYFHFFVRRSHIFPYEGSLSFYPLTYSYMGVQMFFCISGYVIYMSLERTSSISMFLILRSSRIYVPLIIILPIVFFFQKFIPGSPFYEDTSVISFFLSLFMIPPNLVNWIFETNIQWLSLVLWSLKVEIIFYVLAGFLFYRFNKNYFLASLSTLSAIQSLLQISNKFIQNDLLLFMTTSYRRFEFQHFFWFVLGIYLYKYSKIGRAHV